MPEIPETPLTPLPRLLAWLRALQGMSQRDLARVLAARSGHNIDRHRISKWENGWYAPDRFWRHHLGAVLGVDEAVLKAAVRAWREHQANTGASTTTRTDTGSTGRVR